MSPNHHKETEDVTVMNTDERAAWVAGVITIAALLYYIYNVAPQLQDVPPEEVSWVPSMLWAIGISIVGNIVGSILSAISGAVSATVKGLDAETELATDVRDKEIGRRANRIGYGFYAAVTGLTVVLAMIDASTFWIGSAAFVIASLGTLAEAGTKIFAYRRGM